jgi:hypothetical protein
MRHDTLVMPMPKPSTAEPTPAQIALGTVVAMLFMPKIEIGRAKETVGNVGADGASNAAKNAANQAFH